MSNEQALSRFQIGEIVGQGTFSDVYKGIGKSGQEVAIKKIRSTSSPSRSLREIKFLHQLGGEENVVKMIEVIREGGSLWVVMPYIQQIPFKDFYYVMQPHETRYYFRELFRALQHVHSKNIIHRDIKPNNILFARNGPFYSLTLIDFGLAQKSSAEEYRKNKELHKPKDISGNESPSRAGTRGYRAPEVLLHVSCQSTAIDIWSVGVILLSILSGRYPFFTSPDDLTALAELGAVFGTEKLSQLALLFGKEVHFPQHFPPWDLKGLCTSLHKRDLSSYDDSAFELLSRCLDINPNTRITAEEALRHPFLREEQQDPRDSAEISNAILTSNHKEKVNG